jgi:hypothetical protein
MIESNQQKYNEIESNLEEESMKYENTKMLINEMNAKANIPKFVFKVKKLGVKGYTHKTRLLYITPEKISYYYMVEKNEKTQKFLNLLNSLYKVIKNEEYDKQVYKEMVEEFDSLPDDQKVLKHSFRKYEILVQDHFSSFNKAPIKINNLEKKNENEKTKTQDFWIMETGDECFRKTVFDSQKVIEDYLNNIKNKEKEDMSTNFATNRRLEMASTNTKYNNREFSYMKSLHYDYYDEIPKKKKVKTKEVFTLEKDKIHYIGIYFQGFVREYLGQINKNMQKKIQNKNRYSMKNVNEQKKRDEDLKKILYLELIIYYCYNIFVKHCEKVVIQIIDDLNTFKNKNDILKNGRLHPIIFPNPFSLTQENNAVLLYSIWGVNYTLTWNNLKGKFNNILSKTKGKWKGLKYNYKQKNCLQDILTRIAKVCSNTNEFPSIPLSCIIDYNGFRVYCESDIFASEDYLEGLKLDLVQNESTNFIKELTKYIILKNNEELLKEYVKQTKNIFCNISNETIANEKWFDFEKSLEVVINDFKKSFMSNKNNEINDKNDTQTKSTFYKSENQMIKIAKNIIRDTPIFEESEENFSKYTSNSILKQLDYEFFYLITFDILTPIITHKLENRAKAFYRQEIFINNIDFKSYEDIAEEEYINMMDELSEKSNNEEEDEEEEEIDINNEQTKAILYKDEDEQSKEKINKLRINSQKRFLEIFTKNTFQNNPAIEEELSDKFKINFESLLMALDSLYLVPYNSETLKICFHYYGINLCYLGKIAERSTIPHIRELCLIDMFARVCKKIIFDLLAQNTFEKATNAFYSNVKKITGKPYLIPLSFKENYGGDYLTMITLPIEDTKFLFYNGVEVKGLYLQNEEYPFINNNGANKEKESNKESHDSNYRSSKNENVLSFFNILLGNNILTNNNKLIIYDTEINNTKELWNFIINKIRKAYDIKNDDVFMYCDLDSISLLPLVNAILYHTGIKFKDELGGFFDKIINQKYSSRATFEEFYISPKISYNNFSYFFCKENIILPIANNFGMHYAGRRIYYQAKLNYYAEQYLYGKKIAHNYYYLFYHKILKNWDTYEIKKVSGGNSGSHNQRKEFDKNIIENRQEQIAPLFEDNFDTFISLMISQYQPKSQKNTKKLNQSNISKIDYNNIINYCERIISIHWNKKHPFMSILFSTYAKALYKNTNNRKDENKINSLFFKSADIARDSLGELNVFYGKLTRDIGLFCEKKIKFKEAYQMFSYAFKVFQKHKNYFKREYFYCLKHLTKNCVNLGQLKNGLDYGIQLLEEITQEKPTYIDLLKNNDNKSFFNDDENNKQSFFWEQINNMDGFTFNLIKIAKYLGEYDTGVKLGNIFFNIIDNRSDYIFPNFKNWMEASRQRVKEIIKFKNEQNTNKDEFKTKNEIILKDFGKKEKKNIDNFIKVYLKCLFKGLKGTDNKVLAKAYVTFIENCKEPKLINAGKNKINELFYEVFFRDNGETFEEHFKNKILYFLLQKYRADTKNNMEIEKNYQMSKYELEVIYFKFPKGESKLFDL